MKKSFLLTLTILILAQSLTAAGFITLADEIQVPVPEGWRLGDEGPGYPFKLVQPEEKAELLIFKTQIDEFDTFADKEELKTAVDGIIDELIAGVPEGRILTSTGYFEKFRTGFRVEFTSLDTVTDTPLKHSLMGMIYRLDDGSQVLFTLWGKSPAENFDSVIGSINTIQDGFIYKGPYQSLVFNQTSLFQKYYYVLVIALVLALFYLLRTRRLITKKLNAKVTPHSWRCECGRINHIRFQTCRRCGQYRDDYNYN